MRLIFLAVFAVTISCLSWILFPFLRGTISGRGLAFVFGESPISELKSSYDEVGQQYFINPVGEGVPFFVGAAEINQYWGKNNYEIASVPPQKRFVKGTVLVLGWGKADERDSKGDLYLHGYDGVKEINFRVSGAYSPIFGDDQTRVVVRNISTQEEKLLPNTPLVKDLGMANIQKIVRRGDVVDVYPVWDVPVLSKSDSAQVLLVSSLVLRRRAGIEDLRTELQDEGRIND